MIDKFNKYYYLISLPFLTIASFVPVIAK